MVALAAVISIINDVLFIVAVIVWVCFVVGPCFVKHN